MDSPLGLHSHRVECLIQSEVGKFLGYKTNKRDSQDRCPIAVPSYPKKAGGNLPFQRTIVNI